MRDIEVEKLFEERVNLVEIEKTAREELNGFREEFYKRDAFMESLEEKRTKMLTGF